MNIEAPVLLPYAFVPVAVALADEGVPVAAIARSMKSTVSDVQTTLQEAVDQGQLIGMPRSDWPPGVPRDQRVPQVSKVQAEIHLQGSFLRFFKLTPLQADVFALLCAKKEVSKQMVHHVIEQRRLRRQNTPQDMAETELKMVDVVICHLRRKIKSYGITIETMWGYGYYMGKDMQRLAIELATGYTIATGNGDADGGEV